MTTVRHGLKARSIAVIAAVLLGVFAPLGPASGATIRQQEWFIDKLYLPNYQAAARYGSGVTVAVLDGGVEESVPALNGRVAPGRSFNPGAAENQDGRTDTDDTGHGTSMAGIIAGNERGEGGYIGVAPAAKILPVVVGDDSDRAAAIRYAADQGAKVINISASYGEDPTIAQAIRYAMDKDAVVVAAAGNIDQGSTVVDYPARIPGVVAVGAVDSTALAWKYSTTGPQVTITAPGVQILAPVPTSLEPTGYGNRTGTSSATAFVSGMVALIRAKFPDLNAPSVINRLITNAQDVGTPGKDPVYGYGVVYPRAALTGDIPRVAVNPLGTPPPLPSSAAPQRTSPPPALIATIAVAAVLVLAVVGLVVVLIVRRSRRGDRT